MTEPTQAPRHAPKNGIIPCQLESRSSPDRALYGELLKLAEHIKASDAEPRKLLGQLQARLATIGRRHQAGGTVPGVLISEVRPEKIRWAWQGYVPLGKITLGDGDPGLGKTTMALDLAARVTRGAAMPDATAGVSGGVVVLSAEDGLADTIRPRLEAAGADLARVRAIKTVSCHSGERFPTIPGDIHHIEAAIESTGALMVLIDPLMAYLGTETNSWRDQDVRLALAPLAEMAEARGVAILVIRHLNKATGLSPIYRGGGSIGIIGAARSGLLVARDPDDDSRRVLASIKSNLGPAPPSLTFSIETVDGVPRISWAGRSQHSAATLLEQPASSEERSALDEATDFLAEQLKDGAVESKSIITAARRHGIAEKTLRRAKEKLGAKSDKEPRPEGRWLWRLPHLLKMASDEAKMVNQEPVATFEQVPDLTPFSSGESPKMANPECLTTITSEDGHLGVFAEGGAVIEEIL